MRNTAQLLILSLAIAAVVALTACSSKPEPAAAQPQPLGGMVTAMAKMGNLATDPFTQMSFSFEGHPSNEEIQGKLDKALMLYGLDMTFENRSSAGRTLVALRKEHGHSEMAILDKMLSSPAEGKFEDAAAKISAAM